MSAILYNLLQSVLSSLDGGWIFIIALGLIFILFILALLLSCLKPLYSLAKRAWFFFSCSAISLLELTFLKLSSQIELFYLTISLALIFSGIIFILPTKRLKVKDSERNLAKLIDQSVRELEPIKEKTVEKIVCQPTRENEQEINKFELDFQHVKLVLQKLEYYPLSASDKKIAQELEQNIEDAQRYGFSTAVKSKINDGLGALLKIMSKYGV